MKTKISKITEQLYSARMNKSCCFLLQYNTAALVLVLQYYIGKRAILKQYKKICLIKAHGLLMGAFQIKVTKEIKIRRV
jgi:hypothetical protein